jgi:hypothetical protein
MRFGRERDIVSQSPRPESCFGDVTRLALENADGSSIQTILPHVPRQFSAAGWVSHCDCGNFACCAGHHTIVTNPCRSSIRDLLGLARERTLTPSPTAAQCQASVAERQSSSRLNGGEAVMAPAPRSSPAKRRTNRKAAAEARFNHSNQHRIGWAHVARRRDVRHRIVRVEFQLDPGL